MRTFSIALLIALAGMISRADASRLHCQHCGCQQNCRKVCRLICGKKEEFKAVYSCECEDFCIPGRSEKCGEKWVCNRLGMKCREPVYKPTCATVHTKRVLVKKEVKKEVPDYKWVVEEVCCRCGERIDGTQKTAVAPKPATAFLGGRISEDALLFEAPADVRQVSAEEEMTLDASPDAAETDEAVATDEGAEQPKVEKSPGSPLPDEQAPQPAEFEPESKPRTLLQRIFGK